MPTIRNLTPNQVALLDEMWACETYEEYETFLNCLDAEDRAEAEGLQRLLLIEMLDEEMANQTQFPEAKSVLDAIAKL
jgi:hypothetical protein